MSLRDSFISSVFLDEKTMYQVLVKFSVNLLATNHRCNLIKKSVAFVKQVYYFCQI